MKNLAHKLPRTFALCVVQNFSIRRSGLSVIKIILLEKCDDYAKWSFEASGVYTKYSSIAEQANERKGAF